MANSGDAIDLSKAMLDPTAVFRGPEDVLQRAELTRAQKIEILRRWKFDALELQVAEKRTWEAGSRRIFWIGCCTRSVR